MTTAEAEEPVHGGAEGAGANPPPIHVSVPAHEVEGYGRRGTFSERFMGSFGPDSFSAAAREAADGNASVSSADLDGSGSFSELIVGAGANQVQGGGGRGSEASSSSASSQQQAQAQAHAQAQSQSSTFQAPLRRSSLQTPRPPNVLPGHQPAHLEGYGRRGTFSERFTGSFSSAGSLDSLGRAVVAVRDFAANANESWNLDDDASTGGGGGARGGGGAPPSNLNPARPVEGFGRRGTDSDRFMGSLSSFGNGSVGQNSFSRATEAVRDVYGQFEDSAQFDAADLDNVGPGPGPGPASVQRRRGSGRIIRRGSGAARTGRRGSGASYSRSSLGEDGLAGAAAALRVSLSEAFDEDEENHHDEEEEDKEEGASKEKSGSNGGCGGNK
mmetsp:Transcript_37270/g.111602  ORF Transcript_37270/g.111602 Transcript_37270/m.111602 type:complete len:386 (-) Transcript_37270:3341-4498(-)